MDEPPTLRWSGSYVAVASTSSPGDKIILPQSALEQLLAAAHSGSPDDSQQLPHPFTFRLVNPANGNVVYAGIREFSAREGTLGLSAFLSEALGVDTTDAHETHVAVFAHQLPKGTYVRLRPLEAGYDAEDWKSLLERHLRDSFTCLTKNARLSVPGVQGETFDFVLDRLAPDGDGICVVDTDLEVDIEALDEEQARETMRQIMSKAHSASATGSYEGGQLDMWKDLEGQVSLGGYVDHVLPAWDRSQPVTVELSGQDGLDLFITPRSARQRALPRDSAHVFGNFGPEKSKSVVVTPSHAELEEAESLLVSVHAYQPADTPRQRSEPLAYTIRVSHGDKVLNTSGDGRGADDEQCDNCLQWVPKPTAVLHQNFCRRNNVVCTKCKSVFKKGSADYEAHWHCEYDEAHGVSPQSRAKHYDVFHKQRSCPSCDFSTNSLPDLARHRTTVCPGKLILCRFCHLEVPQEGDPVNPSPEVVLSGMTAHELADGARTTECHMCDKIVRLRDMGTHLKHHELDKVSRSKPAVCCNANCGRTLHGVGPRGQVGARGQEPGNEMGLCSLCFGPLYVSMHDPEGKALRRRIERRYLGQLMTGCGKKHCTNEWCKTGRANAGLEPKGSSAQAALPLVKPLLEKAAEGDAPTFFCVDEASQRRRSLATMVATEKVWDLEWCVAAAEAEKGQVDRMRDWLQAWAPRRAAARA